MLFLYPLENIIKVKFSDVFRVEKKGALGTNGLICKRILSHLAKLFFKTIEQCCVNLFLWR